MWIFLEWESTLYRNVESRADEYFPVYTVQLLMLVFEFHGAFFVCQQKYPAKKCNSAKYRLPFSRCSDCRMSVFAVNTNAWSHLHKCDHSNTSK